MGESLILQSYYTNRSVKFVHSVWHLEQFAVFIVLELPHEEESFFLSWGESFSRYKKLAGKRAPQQAKRKPATPYLSKSANK